jgi:hypothetical protein
MLPLTSSYLGEYFTLLVEVLARHALVILGLGEKAVKGRHARLFLQLD